MLTNIQKDLCGQLQGLVWILMLWDARKIIFPMNDQLQELTNKRSIELKNFVNSIILLSYFDTEEKRTTLLNTIENVYISDPSSDTAEMTNIWLSVYGHNTKPIKHFTFSDKRIFIDETIPIVQFLFSKLITSITFERGLKYESNNHHANLSKIIQWQDFISTFEILYWQKEKFISPDHNIYDLLKGWIEENQSLTDDGFPGVATAYYELKNDVFPQLSFRK